MVSVDISVLLKIYRYEYEYAKFSWILSMGLAIPTNLTRLDSHNEKLEVVHLELNMRPYICIGIDVYNNH
jgi:hypothetical protein